MNDVETIDERFADVLASRVEALTDAQRAALARRLDSRGVGGGDASAGQALVAYVTARDGTAISLDALKRLAAQELPASMVPARIEVVDRLPRTAHGKVDRRALAARPLSRAAHEPDERREPCTPTQRRVVEIWRRVLGLDTIGIDEHFVDLGGHSLLATRIVSRLRDAFNVALPIRSLFDCSTPRRLAARLDELVAEQAPKESETLSERHDTESAAPDSTPIARAPRDTPAPLSFAQQRLWFLEQFENVGGAYHYAIRVDLKGNLDVPLLARCLHTFVQRHEILRTTIDTRDGQPVQVIGDGDFDLAQVNPEGVAAGEIGAEANDRTRAIALAPFDLRTGPLFRAALFRLGPEHHALLLSMHHVVGDAWSLDVLFRELSEQYERESRGQETAIAPPPIQYADFASWQRRGVDDDALESHWDYWQGQMAGAPQLLDLPLDHPRPRVQTFRGARRSIRLPASLADAVRELSRRHGATPFAALLSAFKVLLWRYTGQDDLVVGSPFAGRNRSDLESLFGLFTNVLPLRTTVQADESFGAFLGRVRETTLQAQSHQDLPFERLVERLNPHRALDRSPLFQVVFLIRQSSAGALNLPGVSVDTEELDLGTAKLDLGMAIEMRGDEMLVEMEYNVDLFEPGTIDRMLEQYQTVLERIVADPDQSVAQCAALPRAQHDQVVSSFNVTHRDLRTDALAPDLFEQQVRRAAGAVAVVEGDEALTYRALNERANCLARELREIGVEPDVVVAIHIDRSIAFIVAALAVLKAGGAFLALDPQDPPARRLFKLQNSLARVCLTHRNPLEGSLPADLHIMDLDAARLARHSCDDLPHRARATDLAYVIYTSGTTGNPKGVAIEHRSLANLIRWHIDAYRVGASDRASQMATLAFDASVWEVWPSLCAGASVDVAPDEVRASPSRLADWLHRREISIAFVPTVLAEMLLDHHWPDDLKLRFMLTGGDRLRKAPDRPLPFALVNHYGPTENTVVSTAGVVAPADSRDGSPPIGRPIANTTAFILDARGRPVPIGVPGELHLGGIQLARGYLRQPELTGQCFTHDPFSNEPGARLYRTGDRCRWRPDGQIEFLGRLDQQVKVRGFRIEPAEIEEVLLEHPAVSRCAVLARGEGTDRRLIAFMTAVGERAPLDSLRAHVAERLPSYMRPSSYVWLDALPMNTSGKVDRRALLTAGAAPAESIDAHAAPRSRTERELAAIWTELLGIERIGVHDDFFDLGGHSLSATQLAARISEQMQVEIPIRRVFEAPTIAQLSGIIDDERAGRAPSQPAAVIPSVPRRAEGMPASFAQRRLWFLHRLESRSAVYHVPVIYRIAGPVDAGALQRALDQVLARHEALRTSVVEREGEPVQVIREPGEAPLRVIDLRHVEPAEQARQAQRLIDEEAVAPFDLTRDLMLRAMLVRLADDRHILMWTMHHIASDGWSVGVLLSELSAFYEAHVSGQAPAPAPPLSIQYADYAVWQRQRLAGDRLAGEVGYWKQQLKDAPPLLDLPADRPRPPAKSYRGDTVEVRIPDDLAQNLGRLGRDEGVTLFITLLAAFKVLLFRYARQTDIVVGTAIAGRRQRALEPLIGFFVNTLALRTDLSGQPSFRALLRRVRDVTLAAHEHQEVPFEKLVEELNPPRSRAQEPFFQCMFVLNQRGPTLRLPEASCTLMAARTGTAKFDLTLALLEGDDGLCGHLEYASDLFDRQTAQRMVDHYLTLLGGIVARPDQSIARLPMLPDAERSVLLEAWNGWRVYPVDESLHTLFERQAARRPHATALKCDRVALTYRQLDEQAARIAGRLRREGVQPGDIVGIFMKRSVDLVPAILGVLKAGAAYLPCDAAYPAQRVAFMLKDAGARLVLTQRDMVRPDDAGRRYLDMEEIGDDAPAASVPVSPQSLAYVIYTSGSTGQPKGVKVTHANVVRLLHGMCDRFTFGQDDIWTLFHSHAFDFSVWEMWGALACGGCLIVVPFTVSRSPEEFYHLLRQERVTILNQTPTAFYHLLRAESRLHHGDDARLSDLRYIILSGEALDAQALAPWFDRYGDEQPQVINAYGITETTVFVTSHRVGKTDLNATGPGVIGVPLPDLQTHLLDDQGQLAPIGVTAELYIGGPGVTEGYLHRPDLTAERFVADPFTPGDGATLYRSGDLARWRHDGELEFLGRVDHQIELRGFRIEPGEIEAVLMDDPAVQQALVVCIDEGLDASQLVAYLVVHQGRDEPELIEHLRAGCRKRLPPYMIPAHFLTLAKMPLTSNGKIDRRALPAPGKSQSPKLQPGIAPRTATEESLVKIWRQLLRTPNVGVHDDFFDLGGHSILAVKLINEIEDRLGRSLPLAALFEGPTIADLARLLDTSDDLAYLRRSLVILRAQGARPPLFLVHGIGGEVMCFKELTAHLGDDQPVYGLQARGIHRDDPPHESIAEMAEHYISQIRTVQPQGPYLLGGYSSGGAIAFEMARRLDEAGDRVAWLGIIDTSNPDPAIWQNQSAWRSFWYTARNVPSWLRYNLLHLRPRRLWRRLGAALRARLRSSGSPDAPPDAQDIEVIFDADAMTDDRRRFLSAQIRALRAWRPGPYHRRAALFRARSQPLLSSVDAAMGWDRVIDGVVIHRIPGNHGTILRPPHVLRLARALRESLEQIS